MSTRALKSAASRVLSGGQRWNAAVAGPSVERILFIGHARECVHDLDNPFRLLLGWRRADTAAGADFTTELT